MSPSLPLRWTLVPGECELNKNEHLRWKNGAYVSFVHVASLFCRYTWGPSNPLRCTPTTRTTQPRDTASQPEMCHTCSHHLHLDLVISMGHILPHLLLHHHTPAGFSFFHSVASPFHSFVTTHTPAGSAQPMGKLARMQKVCLVAADEQSKWGALSDNQNAINHRPLSKRNVTAPAGDNCRGDNSG